MSTTEIIATSAGLISAALFVVQYINQRERRHGELVQLKMQILAGQNAQRQRLAGLLIQAQTVRLELRRLPDDDPYKFAHIERFPETIKGYQESIATVDNTIKKLERFDTKRGNTSHILMELQIIAAETQQLDALTRRGEDGMIAFLESIRKSQRDPT